MVKNNRILSIFMLTCFIGTAMPFQSSEGKVTTSDWELASVFVIGVVSYFGFGALLESCLMNEQNKQLHKMVEEKAIQDWLDESNLNQVGEPNDTQYEDLNNGPLAKNQSRFDYIKAKFSDEEVIKPWKSGYRKILHKLKHIDRLSFRTGVAAWSLMVAGLSVSLFCQCMHNYQRN